jgi:uncharacterized damage-inducible protein DinB
MTAGRTEVETLVRLLDHTLEESAAEFGWDHWHSLLWNLRNIEPGEWTRPPPGGGRTIRELVEHIGGTWLMYASHAFGDERRQWGDRVVDGIGPGQAPEETVTWLRRAHAVFREAVSALTDDQLGELRKAPWGDRYEARRLVELQLQHTLYHVGEINHIRALLQGNDDWDHQDMGRDEPQAPAEA